MFTSDINKLIKYKWNLIKCYKVNNDYNNVKYKVKVKPKAVCHLLSVIWVFKIVGQALLFVESERVKSCEMFVPLI